MSVYFVSARDLDMIKIGYAFNPVHRYKTLRIFSPVPLTLEGAIPGGYDKERELHKKFALARSHGEWFRMCPGIQAEIDASSRPEKFTWAHVRRWLKTLAEADEGLERREPPPEVVSRIMAQTKESLDRRAARARMSEIERLEADGHIYFPFRELQAAVDDLA